MGQMSLVAGLYSRVRASAIPTFAVFLLALFAGFHQGERAVSAQDLPELQLRPLVAHLSTLAFQAIDQPAVDLLQSRLATFSASVSRVVVLNAPTARTLFVQHGHTALMLVNEREEALFASYAPVWRGYGPGELRLKVLTQAELVHTLTQSGGVTDLVASDGHVLNEPGFWQEARYTRWVSLPTDPVLYGPSMVAKAIDTFLHPGFFAVPFRDCDTIVRDILALDPRLAPLYKAMFFPNWSFDALARHLKPFTLPDIRRGSWSPLSVAVP